MLLCSRLMEKSNDLWEYFSGDVVHKHFTTCVANSRERGQWTFCCFFFSSEKEIILQTLSHQRLIVQQASRIEPSEWPPVCMRWGRHCHIRMYYDVYRVLIVRFSTADSRDEPSVAGGTGSRPRQLRAGHGHVCRCCRQGAFRSHLASHKGHVRQTR